MALSKKMNIGTLICFVLSFVIFVVGVSMYAFDVPTEMLGKHFPAYYIYVASMISMLVFVLGFVLNINYVEKDFIAEKMAEGLSAEDAHDAYIQELNRVL